MSKERGLSRVKWSVGAVLVLVTVVLGLSGGNLLAQEGEGEVDLAALKQEMRDLRKEAGQVAKEIAKVGKKYAKDEALTDLNATVDEARQALMEAQKAYKSALEEMVAADPEGAPLVTKKQEIEKRIQDLHDQLREAMKKNKPAKPERTGRKGKKAAKAEE